MRSARLIITGSLLFLLGAAMYTPCRAQFPNLSIHFNQGIYPPQFGFCPNPWVVADTIEVVASNFNMMLSTIEFGIVPPTVNAYYAGDARLDGALALGNSVSTGVWITYPVPLSAYVPVVVMRLAIVWTCDGTCIDSEHVQVVPNQSSGLLRAIEWQTYRAVDVFGGTSSICQDVRAEDTTWGKVKALYR